MRFLVKITSAIVHRPRVKTSRRGNHSFAPPTVKHHLECIERSDFNALSPHNIDESYHVSSLVLEDPSIQKSSKSLQKVVGIPAGWVKQILLQSQKVEKDDRIWNQLKTWKNVQKGRDLFIPSLGTFNISSVYEKISRQRYVHFVPGMLLAAKSAPIRKTYRKTRKESTLSPPRDTIDDIRSWLARCPTFDVINFISSHANNLDNILKKRDLDASMPFVEMHYVIHPRHRQKMHLNTELFMPTLYSGAVRRHALLLPRELETESIVPFLLVSVHELQALGHFSKALGSNAGEEESLFRLLSHVLAQPVDSPGRQHLVRNYDYWNDPDNIGAVDELVRDPTYNWPEGWDQMKPRQLLNSLRDLDRYGKNVKYNHLEGLPDRGPMRVLRSLYEIYYVADKLHNCGASYAGLVQSKQIVLVVLEDNNGKPIALGSHSLKWSRQGWDQIREAKNHQPSDETEKHFVKYGPIVRKWHKRHKSTVVPQREEDVSTAVPQREEDVSWKSFFNLSFLDSLLSRLQG